MADIKYKKDVYKCVIKTLSPIHIGCDEVYEPTGFVIDENNKKMIAFEPFSFFEKLSAIEKKNFSDICLEGTPASIIKIYKFFKGKDRFAQGRKIDLSNGFINHYNDIMRISTSEIWQLKKQLNSFTIGRTSFLSYDQNPYIPGSSVKGSIRTACLNLMQQQEKLPKHNSRDHKKLEQELLDYTSFNFKDDPFSKIKVGDFSPVGEVKTKISYAINLKKGTPETLGKGPYQILEIIERGAAFEGMISVDGDKVCGDSLPTIINMFYKKEKDKEDRELKQINIPAVQKVSNSGIIRIGRHCGAESVTIEGQRSIKITRGPKNPPIYGESATTLWMSSDDKKRPVNPVPFGWAEISFTKKFSDNFG
ncbi:MAG: type III-A CRISPR-associated RAMP protein Csm5 [Desulfobacterales bacterium]|nr:type III-A CRISPR-associated RAMP protein Csm5 [Desulfobacterales bacterium]